MCTIFPRNHHKLSVLGRKANSSSFSYNYRSQELKTVSLAQVKMSAGLGPFGTNERSVKTQKQENVVTAKSGTVTANYMKTH